MKRIGTFERGHWNPPSIKFPEGDRIYIHELQVAKGMRDGEKIEVSLIEVNGSAKFNLEKV